MRHFLFSLIFALGAASALAAGPTENSWRRHAQAYDSDDKWWKCNGTDPEKGCDTGTLSSLGFSTEEEAFVKNTLDQVTWHPRKAQREEIATVIGGTPSIDVESRQTFTGVGVGTEPNRSVTVLYSKGYVTMIAWFRPGRFLLVKAHSF